MSKYSAAVLAALPLAAAEWETNQKRMAEQPHAPIPGAVALFRATGAEPDDWQRQVLTAGAPRILLNCSRQAGKSTVTAAIAVAEALATPGALVLVLSPSLRQSQELFRKILDVYAAAGRPVVAAAENRLSLELTNSSRILCLPGTERTVRGFSGVRLILIDEASRVEDELYQSVRPMLAVSGGRLMALSTPWGARGWWHAAWSSDERWLRVEVPATMVPRISPEFLAEERRSMGELAYRSEYLCEFTDTEMNVFSSELVAAALDSTVTPMWGGG